MKRNTKFFSFVLAALLSVPLFAAAKSPDFDVNMRIVENGVELATPRMLVAAGTDASMSMSGEKSLSIGLVVNSPNEGQVHVAATIETSANTMTPAIITNKGEWASISNGELEFHILVEDLAASE